jgi:hypothetical protein
MLPRRCVSNRRDIGDLRVISEVNPAVVIVVKIANTMRSTLNPQEFMQ